MEVIAKAHYPKHLHQGNGVKMQFDKTGLYRTSNKKEIAVLEKNDGLNGRWIIVDRVYTPDEQKKIDAKNKREDEAKKKAARELIVNQIAEDKLRTELRIKALELDIPDFMEMTNDQISRAVREKKAEMIAAGELVEKKEKKDGIDPPKVDDRDK